MEALDKEQWEPVQPTDDDAVKVMTIHQAKGLEFDHVFVPGVANGLMPSKRIQQNPAERGYSLDFELRGDAEILPAFDGVLSHFKRDLQAQEIVEERRTMYVALTRARRSLWMSASQWYGELVNAKGPSTFFDELAAWGESSGEATLDLAVDLESAENPMLGQRLRTGAAVAGAGASRRRGRALPPRAGALPPSRPSRRGASSPRSWTRSRAEDRASFERQTPTSASSPRTCASARPPRACPASRARRRPSR